MFAFLERWGTWLCLVVALLSFLASLVATSSTYLVLVLCLVVLCLLLFVQTKNNRFRDTRGTLERPSDRPSPLNTSDQNFGLLNRQQFIRLVKMAECRSNAAETLAVFRLRFEAANTEILVAKRQVEDSILATATELLHHYALGADLETLVARLKGNDLVLGVALAENQEQAAMEIAKQISDLFRQPLLTGSGSFRTNLAIGVAIADPVDWRPELLLKNAELALENAVEKKQSRVSLFTPAMQAKYQRREKIRSSLSNAFENHEFIPHFQPQFNLKTGKIIGVEALARWQHNELGWISPSEFISAAESTGDIIRLGRIILEKSCMQLQRLPADLTLSVNLTLSQILNEGLREMMLECLTDAGIEAHRLKIEVSETQLPTKLDSVWRSLSEIQECGIAVSLDDFGSKFAALRHLTEFEWDEIKIDARYVDRAFNNERHAETLLAALSLIAKMKSNTVIEGVETVERLDALVELGCDHGQGYLFSGPMDIDHLITLFFSRARAKQLASV